MSDLIQAAKIGNFHLVKKLVAMGCDVNMTQGEEGHSALYWAACNGHSEVVGYLVNNGADINQRVSWGSTPLHAAAERGHRDSIFHLMRGKCEVNAQNYNHLDTGLHLAAYRGHLDVCQDLLRYGADVNILNRQGKTAMDEASAQGNYQVLALLQQRLQDPTVKFQRAVRRSSSAKTQRDYKPLHNNNSLCFNSLQTDGPTSYEDKYSLDTTMAPSAGTYNTNSDNCSSHVYNQYAQGGLQTDYKTNTTPGNPQSINRQDPNQVDQQGRQQVLNKEIRSRNSKENIWPNGHRVTDEDEVDGSPRLKLPSERASNWSPAPRLTSQGSNVRRSVDNTDYFREEMTHETNSYENSNSAVSPYNHYPTTSPSYYLNNVQSYAHNGHNRLYQSDTLQTQPSESHRDLLHILQLQIVKEQEEVELLKRKNTELWIQCEKYRNGDAEKSKLLTYCKSQYQRCLLEKEELKKKLIENEAKTKAAIVKLMQHYRKTPIQSSNYAEARLQTMAERGAPDPQVETVDTTQDLIDLDDSILLHSDLSNPKHPQDHTRQLDDSALSLVEKSPQQCSDGEDTLDVKTEPVGASPSPHETSSSSCQSNDSLMSKMIQSYTANCTDHKDLLSAILPVFQAMDVNLQSTMSKSLSKQLQKRTVPVTVQRVEEVLSREWVCGQDYTLLEDLPMNRHSYSEASSSLVFRIQHKVQVYVLKMLTNTLVFSQTRHDVGQTTPHFSSQQLLTEQSVLTSLPPHPHTARVLHHYTGVTAHFQRFIVSTVQTEDTEAHVQMPDKTTFLVLPFYPTTLERLYEDTVIDTDEARRTIPEVFILQKMYDVLSAVHHLERHKVVHRDIKADNIFLDHELRAMLGDFGFARRLEGHSGESIPFVDRSQIIAGNTNSWTPELEAINRGGPESLEQQVSLEDVYTSTDSYAVGKMFYNLLCPKSRNALRCSLASITDNYSQALCYIIKHLSHPDIKHRLKTTEALILLGLLLFGPELDEIQSKTECIIWHQSRMMKLLVQKNPIRESLVGHYTCTIEESIVINSGFIETSFFSHFSGEQMWSCFPTYQSLKRSNATS